MKIIIVGGGSVGAAICSQLVSDGHDITVIDLDEKVITSLSNSNDITGYAGSGTDVAVLKKAGADTADLLIAVSSSDELNLLSCTAAKKLGTQDTIARVRNPVYVELVRLMKKEMGLSMVINPELSVAAECRRMLRFPGAAKIETFCRGRVELVEAVVAPDSPLVGKSLYALRSSLKMKFLVVSVLRGEQVFIPAGDFVIEAGDIIGVTAGEEEITSFFKDTGAYKRPVKNLLIVGGGRVSYYLVQMLKNSRIHATVIEPDKTLCHELAAAFPYCTVVQDDGTKQEVLPEQGLEKADALLALSDSDEKNAIISMYAASLGVYKVVTMIRELSYVNFYKGMGLTSVISPKFVTATDILRYVRAKNSARGAEIESLHRIMNGKVEAMEFIVREEIPGVTGVPLKKLRPRQGVLIACILHGDTVVIPSGDDAIACGDSVIIITADDHFKTLKDIKK